MPTGVRTYSQFDYRKSVGGPANAFNLKRHEKHETGYLLVTLKDSQE